jgi:arylsulfatase A-like enzyme
VSLIALLIACAGERPVGPPPPSDDPAHGLTTSTRTLVWRGLDALPTATVHLPVSPVRADSPGSFELGGTWSDAPGRAFGRLRGFTTPLPFLTDMPRPNYAPLGARLFRGDTEVPFVNDPEDLRGGGWYIDRGEIVLLALESPSRWPEPPRLDVPELAAAARARTWAGDGDPAAFVQTEVTIDGVTAPGLQLPPGGEVRFPLNVPAHATLDFGLRTLPPLLPGEGGGATTVRWEVDGEELGRRGVMPDGAPPPEVVSLERWAGRTVTLTFAADPGSGPNVVITAPTVTTRVDRPPRHVVVVGIDTLRQDALGTYGYERPTSPALDAWAAQSVVFTHAWAPAPRTRPSFRTALTGRWPLAAATAPTIAETLGEAGFRTAGVVANVHLVPRFGFNDGFEHWHYENGAPAETQIERALAWQRAHADQDTFLFLHLMDPHTFYNAPEPWGSRFQEGTRPADLPAVFDRWHIYELLGRPTFGGAHRAWIRAAYDGEVAYMSDQLARFFAALEEVAGRTVTVVHSDHGEEFFEHGAFEHNHTLYEELVRAVLWIRPPGGRSGSPRIDAPVGLVDIVPTLLDLLGVPGPRSDGQSLAAYVDPARSAEEPTLSATLGRRPLPLGHLMFARERWAVVHEGWKYILHTASGEEELYDLATDRHEQADRSEAPPEGRMDTMRVALQEATGWPVRPGWRLRYDGPRRAVELRFDAPIADAGVIDPEAERSTRANLEWGEKPPITAADVGQVLVSPDRRAVRFLAGPRADGHRIWVSCDGPCPAGTAWTGNASAPLAPGPVQLDAITLDATLGTLLDVPGTDERLSAPDSGQLQALEALGYLAPD